MKFEVKNRFTGLVQFAAHIECEVGASHSIKLGLAVKWGVANSADMRGADMRGAYLHYANLRDANMHYANLRGADMSDAYLRGANLRGADMSDAYLRGANLRDADMHGANLRGADMSDAYLRGANLRGANLIHCGTRSDGYEFFAQVKNGKIWIKAGCLYFSSKEAVAHWKSTRADTQLGLESLRLVKNAKELVKIRGLK